MLGHQIEKNPDIFYMGHIALDLPVISGSWNHGELKAVIHGPVDEMVDQLNLIGFIDRIPDFVDAFQHRCRDSGLYAL